MQQSATDRLLRLRDVAPMVGMAKATIYRKIASGEFPRPVSVGKTSVRWRESDLARWMQALTPQAA
ncbi:MAG TPA: AlpA family phage regulatory protein [Noviherbaspirillum sp.]|nr:AlpA family phage regulatory protein [Noviherbaspirillum sp.]